MRERKEVRERKGEGGEWGDLAAVCRQLYTDLKASSKVWRSSSTFMTSERLTKEEAVRI